MNFNKLVSLRRGYMFTFDRPTIMSIKRSPSEHHAMLHEHQYGEKYILSYETQEYVHFAILKNGVYKDCKWKLDKQTYDILVYIKNRIGDKWVRYVPGEYVIKTL